LSNSTGETVDLSKRSQLSGERLAELLSVISDAPDFVTAATFLVAQFADMAGSRRACVLTLDPSHRELQVAASVGFARSEEPAIRVPVSHTRDPLVVSALALSPITSDNCDPQAFQLPFREWTIVPFPQPQFRGAPALLSDRVIDELSIVGCTFHRPSASDRRRRLGHAPCGVVFVEGVADQETLEILAHAAMLAGPVLSRMFAVEEYRRSAERLDQQRDLLTAIVNSLPDPIVITDQASNIVVQNRRAEHLLTGQDGDSEGRRRAVEINNLLFTSHLTKAAMTTGSQGGGRELNLVDPDEGADLLFEVLTHKLASSNESDESIVSVLRDVTDLRRAHNELERQVQRVRLAEIEATRERDRLNLILENVADPILVTDDRSNIILMNRQAEQLFQLEDERAVTRDAASAVRANDTKFTTFISDFTINPALSRREQMTLIVPQTNIMLPVEVVSGKILSRRGEPLAIVSVLHDLTKQVENQQLYEELKQSSALLEDRIRAATADLAEQNARLQWQSRELEKANRLKSEFLASMSHELRTPINALIGYTALMLDRIYGEITDRQEEGLRRIQTAAQHLLALINDILDLAKIEAGRMPLHLENVSLQDLQEIAREINLQMEPLVRKKALTFKTSLPDELIVMHTDRTKVKQILLNLLSNAVKFTHVGGVEVGVRRKGEKVVIDVTDSGIGIRAQDLEAIWEDFRQVDQSRTREFGGTGLGLSITRKLVEALGGDIHLASEYGRGSTFTVTLPLASQPVKEDTAPRQVVSVSEGNIDR
jgi:PAS domain S-box-containing protein